MLIEAFASGVAVIGSSSGEIPHVIGDAGMVVSESDAIGWQQAIEQLTTDRLRRCELARRGRLRAEEIFGWPVVARQHLDFFEDVVEGKQ